MSKAADQLRERNARFPSVTEALFLTVALFVAEFVVAAALRDLRGLSGIEPRDIAGVVTVLGNGILFSALLYYKRMSYASLFHPSPNSVGATIGTLCVPILLMIPAMTLAMSAIFSMLEWLFPQSRWEEAMFERMMSNELAAVVTVCVLAPFLEEMLFRGIILRSFLQQYGRQRAFVYSAALFGLAHLNIYQFTIAFLGGILLAWLYERTRSLWPCILLHGAYNSLVTWGWYSGPRPEQAVWEAPLLVWGISFVLAFVGFSLLRRFLADESRLT
jgi:membrane protease YdiL (CAAX protease family)